MHFLPTRLLSSGPGTIRSGVICGLIFFFLIFPILVILPLSFNAENFFTFTKAMLALDPAGYSFKHYQDFFTNPDWQQALTQFRC